MIRPGLCVGDGRDTARCESAGPVLYQPKTPELLIRAKTRHCEIVEACDQIDGDALGGCPTVKEGTLAPNVATACPKRSRPTVAYRRLEAGPARLRPVVPQTVERMAGRYVAQLDQLLPDVVTGFYLVGSVALDAYRPGRSDVDFVAVVERDLGPKLLGRLRLQHARSGLHTAVAAIRDRRSPLTGTCNGVFIRAADLPAPVSEITPVASHVGHQFRTGAAGSDVSPVAWKLLAEHGVAIRGPQPSSLPLDPQPELLRSWNLQNLESYWRPWASAVERNPQARFRTRPRYWTAWGVLGAPRLHRTMVTGEVVSKEAAGEYALDVFPQRWHPLIAEALAYWRSQPDRLGLSPRERGQVTSEFVFEVTDGARNLGPAVP